MKRSSLFLIGTSLIALAACTNTPSNPDAEGSQSSSVSSDSSVAETRNVTYRGTLEDAGVSIFMEGTHKLILDDGRFVLLESDAVDLDTNIDQKVEVFGAVRPTVEAGGMIMRVERITSLETSSSSSSSSMSSDSSVSETSSISSQVSSATVSSTAASSAAATQSSSTANLTMSADLTAKAAIMAKDKMDASYWTQKYCSPHLHFCIPVHKNWWFKSFGATSSSFWHVEIGTVEMNNIGEGPITVMLVSGSLEQTGMADNEISTQSGMTTGYKMWDNNRHFEIRGPSNLEAAIRYITEHLEKTAG